MSGEGVEGAPRLDRGQADALQAGHEHAPASVVLGDHALDVSLAVVERATAPHPGRPWART